MIVHYGNGHALLSDSFQIRGAAKQISHRTKPSPSERVRAFLLSKESRNFSLAIMMRAALMTPTNRMQLDAAAGTYCTCAAQAPLPWQPTTMHHAACTTTFCCATATIVLSSGVPSMNWEEPMRQRLVSGVERFCALAGMYSVISYRHVIFFLVKTGLLNSGRTMIACHAFPVTFVIPVL